MQTDEFGLPIRSPHGHIYVATEEYWVAYGCSWKGNAVKRNGKRVECGHRHKTENDAAQCVKLMRRERPGNCQDYRAAHSFEQRYRNAATRAIFAAKSQMRKAER